MHFRSLPIAVVACGLLATATPALATSSQTWVSASGANSGACPIAAPCKTFAYAYAQTSANGTINVLSSGDFGPLTIAKSISIVADGTVAAIYSASGGSAIIVNAPGIDVSLRGLTIDLFGSANLGIRFIKGQALHVQNCTIRGTGNGIRFSPSTVGISELYVSDTVISKGPGDGLAVVPTGNAYAKVMIERVRVENTGSDGIMFDGTSGAINATVRDSVASGNSASGITIAGNAGHPLNVMLKSAASINNGNTGIVANGGQIRMGDSTVSGNNLGLSIGSGSLILSYGNNQVNGNFGGGDGAMSGPVAFK